MLNFYLTSVLEFKNAKYADNVIFNLLCPNHITIMVISDSNADGLIQKTGGLKADRRNVCPYQ